MKRGCYVVTIIQAMQSIFFYRIVRSSLSPLKLLVDMQDLLDDEAVLDAIDEENEFQALVVSFIGAKNTECVRKLSVLLDIWFLVCLHYPHWFKSIWLLAPG